MAKIYLRVRGGLGNQLFQIAYAYLLLSKTDNQYSELVLDIREFKKYYRSFEANELNISRFFSILDSGKLKYDSYFIPFKLYCFFYHKINKTPFKDYLKKYYNRQNIVLSGRYCPLLGNSVDKDLFLYGYFQDCSLFYKAKNDLYKMFSLKYENNHIKEMIKLIGNNSVSVSVRVIEEQEFKHGNAFNYSSKEYYWKALDKIKCIRGTIGKIIVTSNNIDKIIEEKWFLGYPDIVYLKDFNPCEQLEIIKRCRDFVISNSSFSWWGAFLGTVYNKPIIIAPHIWYAKDMTKKTKLFLDEMEVLDN